MEISPTWMSLSFYYNTFCLIYISTRFGNPLMMNELKNKLKKTPKESGDDWQDLFSHWWTMVHEQWVLIYHKYLSILFQTFICLFLLNIFVWTFSKKNNIFLFWTVFTCSRGFLKTGVIKKKLTAQGIGSRRLFVTFVYFFISGFVPAKIHLLCIISVLIIAVATVVTYRETSYSVLIFGLDYNCLYWLVLWSCYINLKIHYI